MIVTTGNDITGHNILEYLGIVRGITVRTPTWGQGLLGGLQSIGGGDIAAFAEMCDQARATAHDAMVVNAMGLGADAVIAVRYDATELAPNVTEVLAYGTAVALDVGGIGVKLTPDGDTLHVDQVAAGSGAEEAGVVVGDHVLAIEDMFASELDVAGAIALIRGTIGTTVELKLRRDGRVVTIPVVRRRLKR